MAGIIQNILQNSLAGFVGGAVSTAGGYAGSAVSGVGNLIESAGESVGNGIAKGFEGVGNSITAYGSGVQDATAPNAGGRYKKIAARSKSTAASSNPTRKTLSSSIGPPQKSLPSLKSLKALPASPPSAKKPTAPSAAVTPASGRKDLAKAKPTYQAPSSVLEPDTSQARGYKSPIMASKAAPEKDDLIKSRALSSGKVVASPQALPSLKTPTLARTSSLNLPPSIGYTPNGGFKAPSKAGSVAGNTGAAKSFGGHIPGFDGTGKPTSRAPTTVCGNKSAAKPPSSVAGGRARSIIQGSGPRFF